MADLQNLPTQTLFKQWRNGDAASGQAMAQRFSDWYYAVSTCRLGDAHGRAPLQRACVRFQQGILSVGGPGDLVEWAHGILAEEVRMAGGRIAGGDFPNQITGGRSPIELLGKAAAVLAADQVRLLSMAYDSNVPLETVEATAEGMGGYPISVLRARYALKRWLRDHCEVPFGVVPEEPNLDAAPLPLYEAGRMGSELEEAGFEKWMLTNMTLCKDIAEFGVFAQALRAGGFTPPVAPPARPKAEVVAEVEPEEDTRPARSAMPWLLGAAVFLGLLLLLGGAAMFLLTR
jgi:hypothetical protein